MSNIKIFTLIGLLLCLVSSQVANDDACVLKLVRENALAHGDTTWEPSGAETCDFLTAYE